MLQDPRSSVAASAVQFINDAGTLVDSARHTLTTSLQAQGRNTADIASSEACRASTTVEGTKSENAAENVLSSRIMPTTTNMSSTDNCIRPQQLKPLLDDFENINLQDRLLKQMRLLQQAAKECQNFAIEKIVKQAKEPEDDLPNIDPEQQDPVEERGGDSSRSKEPDSSNWSAREQHDFDVLLERHDRDSEDVTRGAPEQSENTVSSFSCSVQHRLVYVFARLLIPPFIKVEECHTTSKSSSDQRNLIEATITMPRFMAVHQIILAFS